MRVVEVLLTIVLFADVSTIAPTSKKVTVTFHKYRKSWNRAQEICETLGGSLYTEDSLEKKAVLVKYRADWHETAYWVWIGLHSLQVGDSYIWVYGKPSCQAVDLSIYSNWEPETTLDNRYKRCAHQYLTDSVWTTIFGYCNSVSKFVCETQESINCTFTESTGTPKSSLSDQFQTQACVRPDHTTCRDECLTSVHNDLNCWAAVYYSTTCVLYYMTDPFLFSDSSNIDPSSDQLFIKECYTSATETGASSLPEFNPDPTMGCTSIVTTTPSPSSPSTSCSNTSLTTHSTSSLTVSTKSSAVPSSSTALTTSSTTPVSAIQSPSLFTSPSSTTSSAPSDTASVNTSTTTSSSSLSNATSSTSVSLSTTSANSSPVAVSSTTSSAPSETASVNTSTTTLGSNTKSSSSSLSNPTRSTSVSLSTTSLHSSQVAVSSTTSFAASDTASMNTSTTTLGSNTTSSSSSLSNSTSSTSVSLSTTSPNSSQVAVSSTVSTVTSNCGCVCNDLKAVFRNFSTDPEFANLTSDEILEKLILQLRVSKRTLSSTIRKKTSATDNRPMSISIGLVAAVFLSTEFALFMAGDIAKFAIFVVKKVRELIL